MGSCGPDIKKHKYNIYILYLGCSICPHHTPPKNWALSTEAWDQVDVAQVHLATGQVGPTPASWDRWCGGYKM